MRDPEPTIKLGALIRTLLHIGTESAAAADSVFDRLDRMYATAAAESKASHDGAAVSDTSVVTVTAEQTTVAAAGDETDPDRFAAERQRLGIDEQHPNLLFTTVLLTHADKAMNNYGRDVIPLEEMRKAQSSLMLQPFDASPMFDRHMRERLWDENGIRGVVYASEIVETDGPAELWVGVAIWARDFPDIAESIVLDHDILGSSFDLMFSRSADNEDGTRNIYDLKFLGGTILYKTRAADDDTRLGAMSYQGEDLTDSSEGSKPDMDKETSTENAVVVKAQETIAEQMTTIASLELSNQELARKNQELEEKLAAAETALQQATERIQAFEYEQLVAARRTERMAEIETIRMAVVSDDERVEVAAKVGAMEDAEYAEYLKELKLSAADRREQELIQLLADAKAQLEKAAPAVEEPAPAADAEAEAAKAAETPEVAPEAVPEADETVDETVANTDVEPEETIAQAGSLSSINAPAATKTPDEAPSDITSVRKAGRSMGALLAGK